MTFKSKKTYIIPIIILLAGIALIVSGLVSGAVSDYNNLLNSKDFEANIPVGNTYNLDISSEIANLNIISTNDVNDFKIEAENVTKSFLNYTVSNNTLKVRYETQKWYETVLLPGYEKMNGFINIYVPANISLKDVDIKCSYKDLNISYLNADRIYVTCAGNENQIKDIKCNYAEINDDKGNVKGMNINAKSIDLNFDAGQSEFSNFVSEDIIINNKSNDMDLSGIINGNCSIKNDSGDMNFTLYGEKNDYNFKVTNGEVTVNGNNAQSNSKAPYTFKINGDMNITIK